MKNVSVFVLLIFCLGAFSTYSQSLDSLLLQVNEEKHDTLKHEDLYQIAKIYGNEENFDLAEEYLAKSLKITIDYGYDETEGIIYGRYSHFSEAQSQYARSNFYYDKALTIFKKRNDNRRIATIYNSIANNYLSLYRLDLAADYYWAAIELLPMVEDKSTHVHVYNNLGILYHEQGKDEAALKSYRKSINLAKNNGLPTGYAYNNIAEVYFENGIMDSVLTFYQLALNTYIGKENTRYERLTIKNNLLEVFIKVKNRKETHRVRNEILNEINQSPNVLLKSSIWGNLGISYASTEPQKAMQYIDSLQYAIKNTSIGAGDKVNIYTKIIDICTETKHLEMARDFYGKVLHLKDSLHETNMIKHSIELDAIHQLERKESKISELARESALQKRSKIIAVFCLILVIIIGGLIFIMRRKAQKKAIEIEEYNRSLVEIKLKAAQTLLSQNKKRLIDHIRVIRDKNEMIQSMQKSVQDHQDQAGAERLILNLKKSKILTKADWNEFRNVFSEAYPAFLSKVNADFPDLTEAEKRLLLLIKLKFEQTEIAEVLGVSQSTVKKTRQRLRKKLPVTPKDNLSQFISQMCQHLP